MEIESNTDGIAWTDKPRRLDFNEMVDVLEAGRVEGIKLHRRLTNSTLAAAARAVDAIFAFRDRLRTPENTMEITQQVRQVIEGGDWIAWLKTADNIHVMVQIGSDAHGQASEARAREIVAKLAGVAT